MYELMNWLNIQTEDEFYMVVGQVMDELMNYGYGMEPEFPSPEELQEWVSNSTQWGYVIITE
jgi:hypothetical protein